MPQAPETSQSPETSLTPETSQALARLTAARAIGKPCAPVRDLLPDGDIDAAYLPCCTMTMRRGDVVVSSGTGAACLGDPLAAVAWLAGTARDRGRPLRGGDIVLSGALGPVAPVAPGDSFQAWISGIGDVTATFTKGPA